MKNKYSFLQLINYVALMTLVGCNTNPFSSSQGTDELSISRYINAQGEEVSQSLLLEENPSIQVDPDRDGAELAIELVATDKMTDDVAMKSLGWKVTNLGNLASQRFQVDYRASNSFAHHANTGSYSNATFGQGTGMSNLEAGESYLNADMSGFGQAYFGKYNLHVCIDPDRYSAEEGLHNDADPSNNCAEKSIIVLDADATDAHLIVNAHVPEKRPFHVGDMARGLGFTVINVGNQASAEARVQMVIRPVELLGANNDPNLIDERQEYSFRLSSLESGAELTRDLSSPLMRFAAGRWYMNTCVYRKLADGSEDRVCDTTRAFNVEEYVHDPNRVGAELALSVFAEDLVEGDELTHEKIGFNLQNIGNATSDKFMVQAYVQLIEAYGSPGAYQSSWGTGMGAANMEAGYNQDFSILSSSSKPIAGKWRVMACVVPQMYGIELLALNDANGSNNCDIKYFEIALADNTGGDNGDDSSDDSGDNNSEEPPVVKDIQLDVQSSKSAKGFVEFELSWTDASSDKIDVLRDGQVIATTDNDGSFKESLKGKKPANYQVCEKDSDKCSELVLTGY